jgi:hypothetical protein
MPCAEVRSTAPLRRMSVPAGVLIVLAVLMAGYLLQVRSLFDGQFLIVAGLALGFPIGYLACSQRTNWEIKDCCWMLMLGYLGMLAGLMVDAGGIGFWQLLALCRTSGPTGFVTALDSVSRMPAAYLGMAAGCQCGMWLLPSRGRMTRSHYARFAAMNVWMVVGMSLGHRVAMSFAANLPIRALGGVVLLSMLVGMGAGGILVYWKGGVKKVA